jgi:hypothetical protein
MNIIIAFLFLLVTCSSTAAEKAGVKPGFEKQILDVTYGEIWRPVGWHYSWFTTSNGAVWTISKEDATKGPYETGMRIQLIPGVKAGGKTAEQVARGFIAEKVSSVKVERLCDEKASGEFRIICLETTEPTSTPGKSFRILYSVSWSNERDWFVISVFGAPERDWDGLKPTLDAMTEIILVGAKFYEKRKP